MLVLGAVPGRVLAAQDAALAGVVRDTHGTPQMGALIELLGSDSSVVARGFTDDHGRYLLASVLPGRYQLRASAAFLVPVLRGNLRLAEGAHAIANVTMIAIFESGTWLPTEKRGSAEPVDDWKWTLRSTANRPLLRIVDDPTSQGASSSSAEHPAKTSAEGRFAILSGDGAFAQGGTHQVFTLDRASEGGEVSALRANVGDPALSQTGPSLVLNAGFERHTIFGGGTRLLIGFESHPELQVANGSGLEVAHFASAEKIVLGDAVMIDAGTLVTAERLLATRLSTTPYLRVSVAPSSGLSLEYRLATGRELQSSEDLDGMSLPVNALSDPSGRPILMRGLHQEITVGRSEGRGLAKVSFYKDDLPTEAIEGNGRLSPESLSGMPVIADAGTDTFRVALRGYTARGVAVSWTETITPAVAACVEADLGTSQTANEVPVELGEVEAGLHSAVKPALSATLHAAAQRSGTSLRIGYRWQPNRTVTQVDEYDTAPSDAYFNLLLKQKLWVGGRLRGIEAVVEATNLLAQGYQPVVGPDGQTLFLAQMPRALQGGLLFSF